MRLYVCSVYDAAVKAFMQPFFCRSKGEAVRSFADACQDDKSNFYKHASDFTLHHLGYFDDAGAQFELLVAPDRLVSANECLVDDAVFPPDRQIRGIQ